MPNLELGQLRTRTRERSATGLWVDDGSQMVAPESFAYRCDTVVIACNLSSNYFDLAQTYLGPVLQLLVRRYPSPQ